MIVFVIVQRRAGIARAASRFFLATAEAAIIPP
jgi:hypothetical protein